MSAESDLMTEEMRQRGRSRHYDDKLDASLYQVIHGQEKRINALEIKLDMMVKANDKHDVVIEGLEKQMGEILKRVDKLTDSISLTARLVGYLVTFLILLAGILTATGYLNPRPYDSGYSQTAPPQRPQ